MDALSVTTANGSASPAPFELIEDTQTAAPSANNALASLSAAPTTEKAVQYKRALTMEQFTVTQGTGANTGFVLILTRVPLPAIHRERGRSRAGDV